MGTQAVTWSDKWESERRALRSIASAFEHTKEALLASSHPEAALELWS